MKRGEVVKRALLDEEREIRLSEDLWLNYFNRYLFENGTIFFEKNNSPILLLRNFTAI